jgi:hypothetical protein
MYIFAYTKIYKKKTTLASTKETQNKKIIYKEIDLKLIK